MVNTITPTPSMPPEIQDQECSICLGKFWGSRNVVRTPCNHYFHDECISQWFSNFPSGQRTCGHCNSPVSSFLREDGIRENETNPYCFYENPLLSVCRTNDIAKLNQALSEDPGIAQQYFRSAISGADVTLLYIAAQNGADKLVKRLIVANADVNAAYYDGATPLITAAAFGHDKVVKLLIEAKADLNAADKNGTPPLITAAAFGHDKVVKLLIEARADLNAADKNGITPLVIAAAFGHDKVVKLLIEAKVDLNAADKKDGATPLIIAAFFGYDKVVKLLIEAKADLNAADKDGAPPLLIAAEFGHDKVVKLLIEAKANLNIACKRLWYTPLSIAAKNGHLQIVHRLLESGADPEKAGMTLYPSVPWPVFIVNQLLTEAPLQAALRHGHWLVAARINNHIRERKMVLRYQSQSNSAFQYTAHNLD